MGIGYRVWGIGYWVVGSGYRVVGIFILSNTLDARWVGGFCVSILCMYSVYVFRACILCMYSMF